MGKSPKDSNSLSSFLLSNATQKDSALDNIFSNSKGPSVAFKSDLPTKEKKSKKDKKYKKKKSAKAEEEQVVVAEAAEEEENEEEAEDDDEEDGEEVPNDADLSELDSDEAIESSDDDGVEEAYAAKLVAARLKALASGEKLNAKKREVIEERSEDEEDIADDDLDLDDFLHETIAPRTKSSKTVEPVSKKSSKTKASDESPEERDARTIFLGNVPVSCSTSRPLKKALIRHVLHSPTLLSLLPPNFPTIKASTIRFRSLAFASTIFGRKPDTNSPSGELSEPPSEPGGRGRKRAREWRDTEGTDERGVRGGFREKEKVPTAEEDAQRRGKKGALTDGQKRRVAFIRGELNEGKKACNAYLVLEPLAKGTTGLGLEDLMDLIIKDVNGSTFESFTLRADRVRPRSAAAAIAALKTTSKPSKSTEALSASALVPAYTVPPVQARRTIFMGGLDFAENEENVRAATEAALVKARGPPGGDKGWVEGVRLIRDASTGLGKGFGYVLLKDAECVDELLALPFGQPLKVSKRKPRLERCKTGVAAARAKAASQAKESKISTAGPPAPAFAKPRLSSSRPSTSGSAHQEKLAEVLAKLPVDERKAIKAIDPERLWRRAQKKKNKLLTERHERKTANGSKNGKNKDGGILGREGRGAERARKEKKRVQAGNKTGKRAKF